MEEAAHGLLGLTLSNNWLVFEKIEKIPGESGSFFSVCYKVKNEQEVCFLKAFDFTKFKSIAQEGTPVVDIMTDMLNAHRYERDLSNHCKSKHLDKIVTIREAGEVVVPYSTYPIVPYLIFDLADGDIRKRIKQSNQLDVVWCLNSLHNIAVGLKQLHSIDIAHQDLKPSNILVFNDKDTKIADIGRSLAKNIKSPYDNNPFPGDINYAPPEILYGFYETDWAKRTFATDTYLLGSLIVFFFSGASMTALIRNYLPNEFSWEYWNGSFDDVKDYLLEAFSLALAKFEEDINNEYLREKLSAMVSQLCFPIPQQRGHKNNMKFEQYNLHRFITELDVLYKKAKFNLINT